MKLFFVASVLRENLSFIRRISTAVLRPVIRAPEAPILVDKRFAISVEQLEPFQHCTLRAELRSEKNDIFESYGHYIADSSGAVDLEKDSSFGGTYVGSDCMGLFWSMVPAPGQRKGLRYKARNLHVPMRFNLQLFDRHVQSKDNQVGNILASRTVLRTYLSPNVERTEVHAGRMRGALFVPKEKGKFPGVIDIFGSQGGLQEYRAALLASHGFTVLALPYFNYKDLPKSLDEVELEFFLEAVDWLSQHEKVHTEGIGFVGLSCGGQFALQAAAITSKIRAIVNISSPVHVLENIKFQGSLIGFGMERRFTDKDFEIVEGGLAGKSVLDPYKDELDCHAIEWEKIKGNILSITGEDDMFFRCTNFTNSMQKTLFEKTGRRSVHISYPNTGHLIEPPYMPMCSASFNKLFNSVMFWGGKAAEHSAAQEHAMRSIVSFLKAQLVENKERELSEYES